MLFLALIPVMVLLMYIMWRRSDQGRTRACRWRMDRGATADGVLFRCMTCGAEVRQPDERPPRKCRADPP